MNKKLIIGSLAVALLLTAGITSVSASESSDGWRQNSLRGFLGSSERPELSQEQREAMSEKRQGNGQRQNGPRECSGEGPKFSQEQREAMSEQHQAVMSAIENNDYGTWKELMGDRKITEIITEDNFDQFVQMHQLMKTGDREGAQEIIQELGLSRQEFGLRGRGPMHQFEENPIVQE